MIFFEIRPEVPATLIIMCKQFCVFNDSVEHLVFMWIFVNLWKNYKANQVLLHLSVFQKMS